MFCQCPNGEDEGVNLCFNDYLKKGIVTKYATYDCKSIMYPEMEIVATACNYDIECHDLSDESRCSDEVSKDILIATTVGVAVLYLLIKYSRRIYMSLTERRQKTQLNIESQDPETVLKRLEENYEVPDVLEEVNAYLFFIIFSETKKRRIKICSSFYEKMEEIHSNEKSVIHFNMKNKLDPLIVHYIIDSKFPGMKQKSINLIEEIFGEFLTKIEDLITQTRWLSSIFYTLKRIISIEFKYIDMFKDIFLTIYIMVLSGGPWAVVTYYTNFTSVIVMVMVASIVIPSFLSSLYLLINSPHLVYTFLGVKKVTLKTKIFIFPLVLLMSVVNPILLRCGVVHY